MITTPATSITTAIVAAADTILIKQVVDFGPLKQIVELLALGLEIVGVAIIIYGAILSLALLIRTEVKSPSGIQSTWTLDTIYKQNNNWVGILYSGRYNKNCNSTNS